MHFYHAKMVATDVCMSAVPKSANSPTNTARLHGLRFSFVQSICQWLDIALALDPHQLVGMSFYQCSNWLRRVSSLLQLATLDEPGWSKDRVIAEKDPLTTLDAMEALVDRALQIYAVDKDHTLHLQKQMIQAMKPAFTSQLRPNTGLGDPLDIDVSALLNVDPLDANWLLDL